MRPDSRFYIRRISYAAHLTWRAAVSITGNGAGLGDVDKVTCLDQSHLRARAFSHPFCNLKVIHSILSGNNGVAQLVVPSGGS